MPGAADQAGLAGQASPPVTGSRGSKPAASPPLFRRFRTLAETAAALAVALLLAVGAREFVFQVFYVPSTSMVPTLQKGDRMLVLKAFFNWRDLHEGDIVVFSRPPRDQCPGPAGDDLVKRVIALPGQTIYSAGGTLYVDGRRLAEPYLPRLDPFGPPVPDATRAHPFHVPRAEFYVMGDNRAISCDSRYWGPIQGRSIIGRVVLLFWRAGHPELRAF